MTTQKAVDIFNILQDRYGSPDVVNDEIVDLLNMATYEWLNRLFPSNLGGVINYELDQNVLNNVKPLVYAITANMNGSGILTNAAINAALVVAGAEASAQWYRIGNVKITISSVSYPITFKKHNEIFTHESNFFLKGISTDPSYTLQQDGLKFYPTNSSDSLSLTIIKHPKLLSLSGPVNPELDDQNMYNIIVIALKLAGVATRDEELIMDVRNTAVQITQ